MEIPETKRALASLLDGMEGFGKQITLSDMISREQNIHLLVTGMGAVNNAGETLGKGHGYFDLE